MNQTMILIFLEMNGIIVMASASQKIPALWHNLLSSRSVTPSKSDQQSPHSNLICTTLTCIFSIFNSHRESQIKSGKAFAQIYGCTQIDCYRVPASRRGPNS